MFTLRSLSTVLALALAACAPPSQGTVGSAPAPETRTTLTVTNDSHADVVVYVLRSGMRYRLGPVAGLEVKGFVIPRAAVPQGGSIRLLADPIGITQPYTTEPIALLRGTEIAFRIKKDITRSYYAIQAR